MKKRCSWVDLKSSLYVQYHDKEWGIPVYDDRLLFEMLVLEGFQAGLSWITILNKRAAFKEVFDNFDVEKVSAYDEAKIEELICNPNIVRNRNKILAAINNAKVFIKIQAEFGSFSDYIWSFTSGKVVKNTNGEYKVSSELSDIISKDLKLRGMKYVGTVIVYSYLQAIGVVNDHEPDCFLF